MDIRLKIQETWRAKSKKDRGRMGKELAQKFGVGQQQIQARIKGEVIIADTEIPDFVEALKMQPVS